MAATLAGLEPAGITTTARPPVSAAARATAWPWLPELTASTPAALAGRVEGEQGVERPPGLERPDPLQVLGLGQPPAAELPVQQPGGDHRGAVDPAGDPGGRPLHVGQGGGGGAG